MRNEGTPLASIRSPQYSVVGCLGSRRLKGMSSESVEATTDARDSSGSIPHDSMASASA